MNKRMYEAPQTAVVKLHLQHLLQPASGTAKNVSGNAGFSSAIGKNNGAARGRQGNVWVGDDEDDWEE